MINDVCWDTQQQLAKTGRRIYMNTILSFSYVITPKEKNLTTWNFGSNASLLAHDIRINSGLGKLKLTTALFGVPQGGARNANK